MYLLIAFVLGISFCFLLCCMNYGCIKIIVSYVDGNQYCKLISFHYTRKLQWDLLLLGITV